MRTRLRKNRAVLVDQLTNVLKVFIDQRISHRAPSLDRVDPGSLTVTMLYQTPGDWTHITRATGLFT